MTFCLKKTDETIVWSVSIRKKTAVPNSGIGFKSLFVQVYLNKGI